jgi:hypothetical protein
LVQLVLLPAPPVPEPEWLRGFARHLLAMRPRLGAEEAIQHARLAHRATFLLDPDEGAELWDGVMCRQHPTWPQDR